MWAMIKRAILPVLLLLGGIASLIYGAKFHFTPIIEKVVEEVVEEQEVEETITIPHPFQPPPEFAEFQPFFPPPPPIVEKVTRKIFVTKNVIKDVTKDELEPTLVWEVTVGGVALFPSGNIERTWGPIAEGEAPTEVPSLCPT